VYNRFNTLALIRPDENASYLHYDENGILESIFRSILSSNAVSFALLNEDGIIVIVSERFCNFLGFRQEELVGRSLLSLAEEDENNLNMTLNNARCNSYSIEKRFRRRDGELVWGRLHISLLKERNNRFSYFVVYCEDITSQKTQENERQAIESIHQIIATTLRELCISPDKLNDVHDLDELDVCTQIPGYEQLIAEHFLGLICQLTESDGAYYGYNESTQSLFFIKSVGKCKEELINNLKYDFRLGEDKGLVGKVAATREPLYISDVFSEPRWIYSGLEQTVRSCYLIPLYYDTNLFGVVSLFSSQPDGFSLAKQVFADRIVYYISLALENIRFITDIIHTYDKLNIIQKQLMQAQKMDAIGQLAGGMAHDINNQMTIIQGCIDLFKANPDKVDLDSIFLKIRKAAEYSSNITRQLMFFGRKQPQFKTIVNLNINIVSLQNVLNCLSNDNIEIKLELDPDLRMIYADSNSINQVIMNLVLNARDAMPNGGQLTIKTSNLNYAQVTPPPDVQKPHYCYYVCLSVEDNGLGIEEKMLSRLFEPFFTTKGVNKGVGMGLSVVYGIAKAHEGWVNVVSKPGMGSTFEVYFPAVEQ